MEGCVVRSENIMWLEPPGAVWRWKPRSPEVTCMICAAATIRVRTQHLQEQYAGISNVLLTIMMDMLTSNYCSRGCQQNSESYYCYNACPAIDMLDKSLHCSHNHRALTVQSNIKIFPNTQRSGEKLCAHYNVLLNLIRCGKQQGMSAAHYSPACYAQIVFTVPTKLK